MNNEKKKMLFTLNCVTISGKWKLDVIVYITNMRHYITNIINDKILIFLNNSIL